MSPPALLALGALLAALLAPAAPAAPSELSLSIGFGKRWAGEQKTEIIKGDANLRLNKRKLYYILDKQCTAKITSKYLPCRAPRLLRVAASRALRPPRVLVMDSLDVAFVIRAQPCADAIAVLVESAC